ncbi:MAG: MCE family protein [Micromonosporaceae bacterium]
MSVQGRGFMAPLVKLGLFTVVTGLTTLFLASTLSSYGTGGDPEYRARFKMVAGLLEGDDVRIAGVRVGKVTSIRLIDSKQPEVAFTVDESIRLPKTVIAKIQYRNLVGQRYISLTEGPSKHGRLRPNGMIPQSQTQSALDLTVLFNGFRPLFTALSPEDINKFSFEIIQVLEGESGTVESLLSRTASLTNTLADKDAVIGRVIDNLNKVLATLNARDEQLNETISQLQSFISGLSEDRTAIGESLEHIATLATETSSLVKAVRPSVKEDIAKLRLLARNLNANEDVLDRTFERVPVRLAALTRVGSYGSWFNFFLCDFDGRIGLPDGSYVNPATFHSDKARCAKPGGNG